MNRTAVYLGLNLGFVTMIAVGLLNGSSSGVHPLYLLALFALCSSPILQLERLNGRYALLALFSAVYFLFFGILDFFNLIAGASQPPAHDELLSSTELVILVGGALAHAGYRLACWPAAAASQRASRDWPETTLVLVGGVLWIVSTWMVWQFKVHVIVDTSIENQHRGLAGLGATKSALFILATYLQPLSILILAYTQSKYRRIYMLPVLLAVVLVQLVIGFVVDIKGDALVGFVIVFLTKLLVEGKIPRRWLVAGAVFIMLAWPVLQANRTFRGDNGLNHTEAAGNILKTLKLALAAKNTVTKGPDRANTIFERLSLKGSVEMIVSGTEEKGVAFQNGYTLSPIITAFIPRLIWPDKPDVQTGLLLNKVFQVSEVEDTYISPSHLGELYWNFGWTGVIVGMSMLGLLLGFLGAKLDLTESATLTRVMIMVLTIRLIILGFESGIATQYVMWLRSMLAVGLLHLFLARPILQPTPAKAGRVKPDQPAPADGKASPYFPNLLR